MLALADDAALARLVIAAARHPPPSAFAMAAQSRSYDRNRGAGRRRQACACPRRHGLLRHL